MQYVFSCSLLELRGDGDSQTYPMETFGNVTREFPLDDDEEEEEEEEEEVTAPEEVAAREEVSAPTASDFVEVQLEPVPSTSKGTTGKKPVHP